MTNIPLTKSRLAKTLGVTRQTINTWIEREELVFDETGKMSVDEFNLQKGNKLHPVSKIKKDVYRPISSEYNIEKEEDINNDSDLDYHAARTIREIAEARMAELRLHIMSGEYIEKLQVERIIFERARQFRDGVTATSKRLAPLIVGKESLKEIESMIDKELRYMLDQFSKLPVIE